VSSPPRAASHDDFDPCNGDGALDPYEALRRRRASRGENPERPKTIVERVNVEIVNRSDRARRFLV
jgi:hypothetical protein